MKKLPILIGVFYLIISLTSCKIEPQKATVNIAKASIALSKQSKGNQVFFIYDYNRARQKLELKAVEVAEELTNNIENIITTFLKNNHLKQKFSFIKLDEVSYEEESMTFYFDGFQPTNKKDSIIFWTAMDMTIAKNFEAINYTIVVD